MNQSANINQTELFETPETENQLPTLAALEPTPELERLFELSIDAFFAALYAQMSCLPIKEEISRFIEKTGKAEDRAAAARLAFDRGDADVFVVLKAASKVQTEIHRITGFLRFSPDSKGVYTAYCAPDYFILPALAEHFTQRFGEIPWAIIDEKRGLCLCREADGETQLIPVSQGSYQAGRDVMEDLWRLYHRSVCIESRKKSNGNNGNRLQRQFMPERYHKYLIELSE